MKLDCDDYLDFNLKYWRQYEQVALMANEMKNYALVVESITTAADLMLTDGTRDSAGIILDRAAK